MLKRFNKVYDIFIILVSLLIFFILRLLVGGNLLLYIFIPILGILAHNGISYYFAAQQAKIESSYEYQMRLRNETNENELSKYINQLNEIEHDHPDYSNVIERFLESIDSFSEKEDALNRLIKMNGDSAKRFLQERSSATQSFIIANAKKLIKALIAYSAQSKANRPANIEDLKSVQNVIKSIEGLTVNYDQLLEEVARMGDDFDPEDPGLKDVVENLQELRVSTHVDDEVDSQEDSDKLNLFVTPTKM